MDSLFQLCLKDLYTFLGGEIPILVFKFQIYSMHILKINIKTLDHFGDRISLKVLMSMYVSFNSKF